ncbi:Protein of unknown function [Gryllus bimaculatus]|nr:Protein of unknown function [Gryllus bimaculatus]
MLRNTAGDEGSGDGDRGGREHIRARPHHRRAAAAAAAAAYGTALAAAPPGTDGVLAWTRADVEELRSKHLLTSNSYFAGASSNMAIPFVLPSDQEAEQDYRLLNRLLLDLYDVVRQILLRQRILRQPDDNGDSDNANPEDDDEREDGGGGGGDGGGGGPEGRAGLLPVQAELVAAIPDLVAGLPGDDDLKARQERRRGGPRPAGGLPWLRLLPMLALPPALHVRPLWAAVLLLLGLKLARAVLQR